MITPRPFAPVCCFLLAASLMGCQGVRGEGARVVDASCGQCQLGMAGDGCDLAVLIDGKAYFVDGTGIDDHGDAHGEGGFCNAVRRARVVGALEVDRFVVESFELVDR